MIQFFGTRDHVDTINQFAAAWAPELRAHVRTSAYETISFRNPLPGGVCIFMDFERLLPSEMSLARRLAAAVQALPEKYTVLNDPARYIGRLRLLEVLHEQGINDFCAFRADALPDDLRFPVFVRSEIDHNGPATPLLHSNDELKQALAGPAFQDPQLRKHLMVTEFCDCMETSGIYRKYSVMNIGGTLIPRHLFSSRDWVLKLQNNDYVDAENIAKEEEFLGNFPHTKQVLEIFQLAGVDYGRIDYGVRNGRLQVWEINTNPTVVPVQKKIHALRMAGQAESARRIAATLQSYSARSDGTQAFPFRSIKMLPAKILQHFSRQSHRQHRK
ncbi:MAG: hypothetical protein WDN00_00140 [Limisphaerales bacterium]